MLDIQFYGGIKTKNKLQIGQIIKAQRKAKFMTQAQLADELDISYQLLQKYEYGSCYPPIELIPKICEVLSLELEDIILFRNDFMEAKQNNHEQNFNSILEKEELKEILINYSSYRKRFKGFSFGKILKSISMLDKSQRELILKIINPLTDNVLNEKSDR